MEQFHLTKKQLLFDLYVAFYDAAKHKYDKPYVKYFQKNLRQNLEQLRDDLYNRTYVAEPSTCFIVNHPKKREIFAANFRDRIVQHLYFNYTHEMFEKQLIKDTYSCINERGTSYGVERFEHHIRSASNNWKETCYVLSIDIKGYFINIRKDILLKIVYEELDKLQDRIAYSDKIWGQIYDFDFIRYLSKEIIMLDVTKDCRMRATPEEYIGLPKHKSLFGVDRIKGIPIGNITSQELQNLYLNRYDQYVKRVLKCKHYGRYADDSYYISKDKQYLLNIVPKLAKFLKEELDLDVNQGKTHLIEVKYGAQYLGAYIKPFRTYVANESLRRMRYQIYYNKNKQTPLQKISSNISRIGLLKKYKAFNVVKKTFYDLTV